MTQLDAPSAIRSATLVTILLAVWPVMNFLAHNKAERLDYGAVAVVACLAVGATVALGGLFRVLSRRRVPPRGAWPAAGVALAGFFSYDIVAQVSGAAGWPTLAGMALWMGCWFGATGVALLAMRRPAVLNAAAFAAVVLTVIPAGEIGFHAVTRGLSLLPRMNPQAPASAVDASAQRAGLPNVYYFILDMYARGDVLDRYFDYDNSEFLEFLRARGFRVLERSHSNFRLTEESVTTTLYMDYVIPIRQGDEFVRREPSSAVPIVQPPPPCARLDLGLGSPAALRPYGDNRMEQVEGASRITFVGGSDSDRGAYMYLEPLLVDACDDGDGDLYEVTVSARNRAGSGIALALYASDLSENAEPFPAPGPSATSVRTVKLRHPQRSGQPYLCLVGMQAGDVIDVESIEVRRVPPVLEALRQVRFDFETPPAFWNAYLGGSQLLSPALRTFHELGYRGLFANQAGTQSDGCAPYCLYGQTLLSVPTVMLLAMTPIPDVVRTWWPETWRNQMTFYQKNPLDVVRKIPPDVPQPYYLHAHILSPHPPFIYNPDCSIRDEFRFELDPTKTLLHDDQRAMQLYTEQLPCISRLMEEAVDEILAGDPSALIVIQSDHGRSRFPAAWLPFDGTERTEVGDRARYGTLSAFRVPEDCRQHLREDLSSVNTFRFVFACLAGVAPVYVPDRMFGGTRTTGAIEIDLIPDN